MTRYRTRSSGTYYPTVTDQQFPVSCSNRVWGPVTTLTSVWAAGSSEFMWDEVSSNYSRRRARGEVIMNPFTKSSVKREAVGTSNFHITKAVADTCLSPALAFEEDMRGSFFAWLLPQYVTPVSGSPLSSERKSNVIEETYTSCMAERGRGQANFVESLAEMDKSWRMVRNPLENVHQFLRSYTKERANRARGIGSSSRSASRFLSSEWLRFRYGITPLVSDVKSGLKVVRTAYAGKKERHITRKTGTVYAADFQNGQFDRGLFRYFYQRSCSNLVKVRAMSIDEYQKTAFDDLGLTFHNVVALPWELTRFSFVLDWFGNVGDLIYANIPRINMSHLGACVSHIDENTTVYSPTSITCPTGAYIVNSGASDQVKLTQVVKKRDTRTDRGSFVIRDDFKFDNWKRCTDAAALVGQLLSRIHF